MIGPRVFKTPLPLALLSLIFTVESSKPSTNSEGLGWPYATGASKGEALVFGDQQTEG